MAVLAIGIDSYPPPFRAAYGASDAKRFAALMSRAWPKHGCPDSSSQLVRVRVLTHSAATYAAVEAQFDSLASVNAANLVVMFAGWALPRYDSVSADVEDVDLWLSQGPGACPQKFIPPEKFIPPGPFPPWGCSLRGKRLKLWLDRAAPRGQLLVLDAGKASGVAFIANLLERDPLAASLGARNRVIVTPREWSVEVEGEGGLLTTLLTDNRLPGAVWSDLSDTAIPRGAINKLLVQRQIELGDRADGGSYANVVYERDLTPLLTAVQRGAGVGRSRGAAASQELQAASRPVTSPLGRNYALVVGTDSFTASSQWRPLSNPVLDAETIEGELQRHFGFETRLLKNPTKRDLQVELRALQSRTYDDRDEVLVFIAGHGLFDEHSRSGALVFRDTRPTRDDEFLDTYLQFSLLRDAVDAIPAKHVLVILDVCFSGLFSGRLSEAGHRGGENEYADMPADEFIRRTLQFKARQYVTSGGKEYVPDGTPGHHSPFASRLIDALRRTAASGGILTMANLKSAVETLVPQPRSGGFGEDQPGSDFLFVAR